MTSEMPKFISPLMPTILPPIWSLLTHSSDLYVKSIVNEGDVHDPFNGDDEEKNDFVKMILQIFELVHSIAESKKFKSMVKNVVGDLIYVLILYMQVTEEQIQTWSDDSEKFVEDEDEDGVDYCIRTSGQDILMRLGEEFEEKYLIGLTEAITKHVALADVERNSGRPHWWKTHESAMLALGASAFKDLILTHDQFNLAEYLNLVKGLTGYQNPFLLGRCICTLSKYIETESCAPHFAECINTTIASLGTDKPITLRISAARAVYSFCVNLKDTENERKIFMISKLEIFLDGILQLIPGAQSTLMGLALESLSELLAFDANFTASTAVRVIPLIQALFLKYHDDRFILEHIQDILKIWSQNPMVLHPLQEKMVPTIISILNLQGEHTSAPMQDIALDVLETIVKYSKAPLSPQLIENAFPAAIHAILRTEDHSVMQSGGECLRAFLYASPEQVCTFQNGQGLNYILQVTTMLLNPMSTEFSASFIGRLVITLITKAGNFLGDQIDLLLKAVISKMQLVESLNVIMSLCMIFAHLFLIQMDAVMHFLSSVPGPTGEPAMNFVFSNWLSRQHLFYGTYERKVSVMALCKIFEYGITTKDQRLMTVTIKDLVEIPGTAAAKVRTRSQTSNTNQWISIPIMVKIFKLLINELANLREFKDAVNNTVDGSDDDGSEGDDEGGLEESPGKNLSAFMLFDEGKRRIL
jgi:importin-9